MKMNLFRKVCVTVMGVGVISSLMSVGTFATFTATTTNPGNTFAAGTLKISTSADTSPVTTASNSNLSTAPNKTNASGDFGSNSTCTTVIASSCGAILVTSNVSSEGLEPGQYVKGHITIKNDGTLPAIVAVNVQQMFSTAATTACPSDISGSGLTTGAGTIGACAALGNALNITIHDDSTFAGANGACLYGSGEHTTTTNVASTSSPNSDHVAVAGACDDVTAAVATGIKINPGASQTPSDLFGAPASTGLGAYAVSGAGVGTSIYVSGGDSSHSVTVGSTTVNYWAPAESHTFTVVMAFPDQGTASGTIAGGNSGVDTLSIGRDSVYQGGSVGFDLVWLATQS